MGIAFDARSLESAAWGSELWLAYQDNTVREKPYRIISARPTCTYTSMIDVQLGSP
jgi:hypothetical protein